MMPRCEMCGEWPDCPWKTDPEIMCGEYHPKPMTNADKIRSMTDEELAMFIRDQIIDRNIGIPSETWLDWLRQEAVSNG